VLFLSLLGVAVFFIYGTSADLTRVIMLTVPIETRTITTTNNTTKSSTRIAIIICASAIPAHAWGSSLLHLRANP